MLKKSSGHDSIVENFQTRKERLCT